MIEILYNVIGLERKTGGVLLTLTEYRSPPSPEELERARIEADLESDVDLSLEERLLDKIDFKSEPDTDEGKIIRKLMSAWKTEIPEFFQMMESLSSPQRIMIAPSMLHIHSPLEMWITLQQYVKLGSPSLMSVIKVSMFLES